MWNRWTRVKLTFQRERARNIAVCWVSVRRGGMASREGVMGDSSLLEDEKKELAEPRRVKAGCGR